MNVTGDGVVLVLEQDNGAKIVVDSWRRVYTLNYESFLGPGGRTEPSVSQWIPS